MGSNEKFNLIDEFSAGSPIRFSAFKDRSLSGDKNTNRQNFRKKTDFIV
jgi:hypothetical protein